MGFVQEHSKYKFSLQNKFSKNLSIFFGPIFCSIFPILGVEKNSGKSGSVTHNFIQVSSVISKFRKTNDTIPRKPGQKDGKTGRLYFIGLFHLSPGVQKETPIQVFSCKYCESFKNTYFEEHRQTTASISYIECCAQIER